jgi:hypothetical protein
MKVLPPVVFATTFMSRFQVLVFFVETEGLLKFKTQTNTFPKRKGLQRASQMKEDSYADCWACLSSSQFFLENHRILVHNGD